MDERIGSLVGSGAAIVFATDHIIERTDFLNLGNRQALKATLDCKTYTLDIVCVYLDDLSEYTRVKQVKTLLAKLERDKPTIITGDLNTLRPNMHNANISIKVKDSLVRALTHVAPRHAEFNKRQALPLIEAAGFIDGDEQHKRPTAPAKFPVVGVDYMFHSKSIHVESFYIPPIRSISDHRPIIFRADHI